MNALVSFALKKIDAFLTGEIRFFREVKGDVEWIKYQLLFMQAFLRDAETKQGGDDRVRAWISNIRDIAYKTEDVIDTFNFEVQGAGASKMGALKAFTKKTFGVSGSADLFSVGKDIKALRKRVEDLSSTRVTYGINNIDTVQEETHRSHEFSSADNVHVVGFRDDLQILETKLLQPELGRRVVSILGMGGLGKTTIARKLYNMNIDKFDSYAWICVSRNWEIKDLLKRIIKSVTKEKLDMLESMEYNDLVRYLHEIWINTRYLLVIDDMWSKEIWQSLKQILPENKKRSRIIVTTRIKSVAQLLDKRTYVHELRFLQSDESWELFCRNAFPEETGGCPRDLEILGQQVVKKCGGLPFAIIVLGELLSINQHVDEWQGVKDRTWMELKNKSNHLIELSYRDLSHEQQLCLLYLGLFPEDSEIDAEKLIRLWVAEDFIPPEESGMDLEELAEKCLKELSDRCLIQVVEMKIRTILTCRVHELWRNHAIDKAKDLDFLHVRNEAMNSNLRTALGGARRIVIHSRVKAYTSLDHSNEKIRTLAFLNNESKHDIVLDDTTKLMTTICTRFKLLRVLELKGAGIAIKEAKLWLFEVCETLIHLRYLGLEDTYIDELPKSISKLQLLQTLYVDNSSKAKPPTIIPREVCKLKQLRHLIGYFTVRSGMKKNDQTAISPISFGELTNLQSLRSLDIREWQTREGDNALSAFAKLQNLKILSLRFSSIDNLSIKPLFNCRNLKDLEIYGKIESLPKEMCEHMKNLKYLSLEESNMNEDPMPTLELLPKLLVLRIAAFNVNIMTVTSNGFPLLEELEFSSLRGATRRLVEKEEGAMPNLKLIRLDSVNKYYFPDRFGPALRCGRLLGNRRDIVPTSAFSISAQDILANKEEFVQSLDAGKSITEASTICTNSLQKRFVEGCTGDRIDSGEFQLIDGDGRFNVTGLGNFLRKVNFGECGVAYVVLSIIGPQCTGKSTVLNNLFNTSFQTMENGIWMASCASNEQHTLIMNVEGSDGKERQDDTTFEKQSALFALAVSDIVLINMRYHDIGRQNAANIPLLKIVFTEIMKLSTSRKVTLMLVVRDTVSQIKFETLEDGLKKDMNEIWDSLLKPEAHQNTKLTDFFNVEVVALSNYEDKSDDFKKEVDTLRQRFDHSLTSGRLVGNRPDVVPATAFSVSVQDKWKTIKENKDLDIPAHRVMVATMRCEEIANEKFELFSKNETWNCLKMEVQSGTVASFGKQIDALMKDCLTEYEKEAEFFDGRVRNAKQKLLLEKLLQLVKPTWDSMMEHIQSKTLETFNKEIVQSVEAGISISEASTVCTNSLQKRFAEGCADATVTLANWDTSNLKSKLRNDVDHLLAHISKHEVQQQLSLLPEQHRKIILEQATKNHEKKPREKSNSDGIFRLTVPFLEISFKNPFRQN